MTNPYYTASGSPTALSRGTSSTMRAEFASIQAAFDLVNTALAALAPTLSPAFTGTPTAPTAAPGTNTTQLATCAFVLAQSYSATGAEATANKDTASGYVGLTTYKINFKTSSGTNVSYLTHANTATRTYAFQDRDGTIADLGAQTFTGSQRCSISTLTDGATITPDFTASNQFRVTLGGNRTLGMPSAVVQGQQGVINVYQDATGSRTLAYAWGYQFAGGTALTLSTVAGTRDLMSYSVDVYNSATVTITIAAPGVVTMNGHGFVTGQKVKLTTTGALPTGLTASTTYFVRVIDANTFNLSTTLANACAGTYITTTGTQSGVHTLIGCSITLALSKAVS